MSDSFSETVKKLATTQNPKLADIATIRGTLQHRLFSMGLFEDDVLSISKAVEENPANRSMDGRWSDKTENYPEAILTVGWLVAKRQAAEWLAKNKPMHWARPVFES
jgi:hypothetical protein